MNDAVSMESMQVPSDCPEYTRCSAPICPLDKDWGKRVYVAGEQTCLFLRETVKEGADQRLSVNEAFAELHRISKQWLQREIEASESKTAASMSRGRPEHLRTIQSAASSGSTLDKREAAGERLTAARKEKRQAAE